MFLIKVGPLSEFNLRYFIKSLIFNIFFWLVCLAFTFCNYIYRVSTTSSCICPKYRLWRKLAKNFFENNEFFVQNAVQNVTTLIAIFFTHCASFHATAIFVRYAYIDRIKLGEVKSIPKEFLHMRHAYYCR